MNLPLEFTPTIYADATRDEIMAALTEQPIEFLNRALTQEELEEIASLKDGKTPLVVIKGFKVLAPRNQPPSPSLTPRLS